MLRLVEGKPIVIVINGFAVETLILVMIGSPSAGRKITSRAKILTTRDWVCTGGRKLGRPRRLDGAALDERGMSKYRLQFLRSGFCPGGCLRITLLGIRRGLRDSRLSFGALMASREMRRQLGIYCVVARWGSPCMHACMHACVDNYYDLLALHAAQTQVAREQS